MGLTAFRANGQAERTKAEHAPDKALWKQKASHARFLLRQRCSTYPYVTSTRSHFSVTGYSMVDGYDSGEQSQSVNEAGRLSMASPPRGGPRDAAGESDLCFERHCRNGPRSGA